MKDFLQLFIDELKNIYSAEAQLDKALAEIGNGVKNEKLKEVLNHHHTEIRMQLKRLEQMGHELKVHLGGGECEAMKGLLHECKQILRKDYTNDVCDAALISQMQKIEHYEIASYGTLKAFAKHLQLKNILDLLKESAKEEGHTDHKLTEIAEGTLFSTGINPKASRRKSA